MNITKLDHLVLTVRSIEDSIYFYCNVLGMQEITFREGRKAILCGKQKINLHRAGSEFKPHALKPTPGSADICLIADTSIAQVMAILKEHSIEIIQGPIERTGAMGKINSIYVRDPDLNLIEISNYINENGS